MIEQQAWAGGEFWTGNVEANAVIGVAKPRLDRRDVGGARRSDDTCRRRPMFAHRSGRLPGHGDPAAPQR
ncbi:MAG: hypothetical protein ACRDRL_31095 [Sciscionella sp.]